MLSRTVLRTEPGRFGKLFRFHGLEQYFCHVSGSTDDGTASPRRGNPLP
uniref:Transcription factor, putative n=1 Tax=Arundo donax TaxID=35708 RepID=A0A0A9HBW1_ARUDO